ncbi:MAG: hypothetical protein IH623_11550 [Verrucomicrobia bacterium]|nr:hypothetical protein [Verrucomicrobiota bacterium]
MNAFKFDCPTCGQHIQTEASEIGRTTACPVCKATITIPPPTVEPVETSPGTTETPVKTVSQPANAALEESGKAPAQQAATAPQPTLLNQPQAPAPDASPAAMPASVESGSAPAASEAPPPKQIPVLTPEIKLEIVQAARAGLADGSHWMPTVGGGSGFAYAGKMVDGRIVELPVTSPEATHFSLFGAVLRELDRRNVTPIANGRKEFLDEDMPDASQQVLDRNPVDEAAVQSGPASLTHPQTLTALDILAKRFKEETAKAKSALIVRKLSNLRVEDLVSKLEVEAPVKAEEVATALYHELEEIKERLARVEKALRRSRPSNATEAGGPK